MVKGKKIVLYKVNKPAITKLEATGLTSTGRYENFTTNLPGNIDCYRDDGGALRVHCDLKAPLIKDKEINWVLYFDLVDSFDSENEEVSMTCLSKGEIGGLHVIFSPNLPPKRIAKVISKKGIDRQKEEVF